jgi:hypothetical protein
MFQPLRAILMLIYINIYSIWRWPVGAEICSGYLITIKKTVAIEGPPEKIVTRKETRKN